MRRKAFLTFHAALLALLSLPLTASAETFDIIFYGVPGVSVSTGSQPRLSNYTVVFTGTFTVADGALGRPGALILYRDPMFLGFDVTITTAVRSYNFNLSDPNDVFPGDSPVNPILNFRPDRSQGLRLDAAGRPQRFDSPQTSVSNGESIYITIPGNPRLQSGLTLLDDDSFDAVLRADGTLAYNSRGRVAGTPFSGRWSFGGAGTADDRSSFTGIYLIRSRSTSTTLAPPTGLSAQVSGLSVSLSWQASSGASSYVLEAGTAPGSANALVSDVGGITTLQAQGPPGTFYVRVRARNAGATSQPSNEVSVSLGAATPGPCLSLSAPLGLSSSMSGSLLQLSWSGVAGAASYHLEAGTAAGASNAFNGDVGPTTALQFNVSGVPAGTYFVRVKARNVCGTSTASSEIAVTIP